jgi:hypothetical protein
MCFLCPNKKPTGYNSRDKKKAVLKSLNIVILWKDIYKQDVLKKCFAPLCLHAGKTAERNKTVLRIRIRGFEIRCLLTPGSGIRDG